MKRIAPNSSLQSTNDDISYQSFRSLDEMPNIWLDLDIQDVFLQKPYLDCLAEFPPKGMKFVYLVFYKNGYPIGFALGQIQYFNTKTSIAALQDSENNQGFSTLLKNAIASWGNTNVFFIGNLLVTGEHGFYFKNHIYQDYDIGKILHETATKTVAQIPEKIGATIIKEFFDANKTLLSSLKGEKYHEMEAQPNMIFEVRPDWNNFQDYLGAMSSKYRVRAKRAFKKGKEIVKRELTIEEIQDKNTEIFALYEEIAQKADFNAIELHPNYFYGLKVHLQEDFKLMGYFFNGEMIGFYTMIFGETVLDAHFLGIKQTHNRNLQTYLNMLYDLVRAGIQEGARTVVMARTALEIKSSVGAKASNMSGFVKLKNPILNMSANQIYKYFSKPEEWVPRTPFKTQG